MNELTAASFEAPGFDCFSFCQERQNSQRFITILIFFLGILLIIAPVSGADHVLNPGDSIEQNITDAYDGDTIVLNPGIYEQYNITISKDIIIRANSSAGGSASDTIIDAMDFGNIFCDNSSTGYSLTIEGLTLRNGSADFGGAICVVNGTVSITSSTITDCYAFDSGGAIYSENLVDAVSCDFTDCSLGIASYGGAITSSIVTVTSCTFTDCGSAVCMGGAISSDDITAVSCSFINCSALSGGGICSRIVNATSCAFSGCSVTEVGGAIFSDGATINSCTFTDCQAKGGDGFGGGICSSGTGGVFTIDSSTFSGCSADDGGALFSESVSVIVTSSTFTNCMAADSAGAILTYDNIGLTLTSCNFTNCRAANYAGAIYSDGEGITTVAIKSCNFYNCSAVADYGGAFYSESSTSTIHYSRIYNCNTGTAVVMENGTLDAENNWWGTNSDPSIYTAAVSGGPVDVSPWLVLCSTASPSSITNGASSTVSADLIRNSDGEDTSQGGYVPDEIPVVFSLAGGPGSLSSLSGKISSGLLTTIYSSSSTGNAAVNATVDGQTVNCTIQVNSASVSSSGSSVGSNTNIGIGFAEDLKAGDTISFEMEKGAVYRVVLTAGTDIEKLMITVKRELSVSSLIDKPDTDVYEFEDVMLYYTEDSSLSGREFYFKIPKSWFTSNGYTKGDIAMLVCNEETGSWEELVTAYDDEKGGYYYYISESQLISWMAIAYMEGATVMPAGEEETPEVATAVTTKSTIPETVSASPSETVLPSSAGDEGSWSSAGLVIFGFLLILIIAAGVVTRRKSEKYPDWWDHSRK